MWRENTFSMRSEQGGEERSELLIDVQQMSKIYNEGRENEVRALDNISLSVQWGEFLCIPRRRSAVCPDRMCRRHSRG